MLIETLNLPDDLKKLSHIQLLQICEELRTVLLQQVSKTGGHLASNLGVVELTVMLHRVFETPKDRIIWDVGHQAYVHKLLTGRMSAFSTLRQKNGLSGFPKSEESVYDTFNTGHSSTSISAGLGMAVARELNQEDYRVICVIGDGALTGGLAFEAINHAGQAKKNMLVILNDNEMSIRKNVGALSVYLNRFRSRGFYYCLKRFTEKSLTSIPGIGKHLYHGVDYLKSSIKRFFSIGTLFESFGFSYVGPIDGHNLSELESALTRCKNMEGPILLHVKTVKGKGYHPAETTPKSFHGVTPFDLQNVQSLHKPISGYAKAVSETLCALAEQNEKLAVVSAAMIDGTGLAQFAQRYPNRIFDVGIAEAHAVTFSAGIAKCGNIPVFVVYSSFLQRAYDQILHDVCMQNLHVVFLIDHAGMIGPDGETHQGLFDVSFLKPLPNLKLYAASSPEELSLLLRDAVENGNGPIAIRYEKTAFSAPLSAEDVSLQDAQWLQSGDDLVLVGYGRLIYEIQKAAEILQKSNISCGVLKLCSLKPLALKELLTAAKTNRVFAFEEAQALGGIGETIAAELSVLSPNAKVYSCGVEDCFVTQGTVTQQLDETMLSAEKIAEKVLEAIRHEA